MIYLKFLAFPDLNENLVLVSPRLLFSFDILGVTLSTDLLGIQTLNSIFRIDN